MIATKKKFDEAVTKKVNRIRWQDSVDRELYELRADVKRLKKLVKDLAVELDKPRVDIRGYYIGPDKKEEETCTECPEKNS